MPNWQALTLTGVGRLNVLSSDCEVAPPPPVASSPGAAPPPPPIWSNFKAIWDTGATASVITQAVVDACGLKPVSMVIVHGVHGAQQAEQYLLELRLINGVRIQNVKATKGQLAGADVLIGMDIITLGDFSVTNFGGKTVMSFRTPSMKTVDFVAEHNMAKLKESQTHGAPNKSRPKRPSKNFSKAKKKRR